MPHEYRKGHIPYYVDGERVSRVEYVARQHDEKRKAAHAELDAVEAESSGTSAPTTTKPARKATSKSEE